MKLTSVLFSTLLYLSFLGHGDAQAKGEDETIFAKMEQCSLNFETKNPWNWAKTKWAGWFQAKDVKEFDYSKFKMAKSEYQEKTVKQMMREPEKDFEETLAALTVLAERDLLLPIDPVTLVRKHKTNPIQAKKIYQVLAKKNLWRSVFGSKTYVLERPLTEKEIKAVVATLFEVEHGNTFSFLKAVDNQAREEYLNDVFYRMASEKMMTEGMISAMKSIGLYQDLTWFRRIGGFFGTTVGKLVLWTGFYVRYVQSMQRLGLPFYFPKFKFASIDDEILKILEKEGEEKAYLKFLENNKIKVLAGDSFYNPAANTFNTVMGIVMAYYMGQQAFDQFGDQKARQEEDQQAIKDIVQQSNEAIKEQEKLTSVPQGEQLMNSFLREKYGHKIPPMTELEKDSEFVEVRRIFLGK